MPKSPQGSNNFPTFRAEFCILIFKRREIIAALYVYLDANIDDIVDNDRFGLATYMPKYDMKKLRRDLKTVEAYSLNLLLMYVAHTSYHYEGKSYTANTIITDDYAYAGLRDDF